MRSFAFSLLTVWLVAYAAFTVLISIHDYPQTREMMVVVHEDKTYPRFLHVFYMINEAGSGIKYAITGNPRHLRHFPTLEHLAERRKELFVLVHSRALQGDWCAQLLLSRLHAQGIGTNTSSKDAVRWYTLAYIRLGNEIGVRPGQIGGEMAGLGTYLAPRITEEDWEAANLEAARYKDAGLRCQDKSIFGNNIV